MILVLCLTVNATISGLQSPTPTSSVSATWEDTESYSPKTAATPP